MNFIERIGKTLVVNFTSRKFLMTIFALLVNYGVYWQALANLWSFEGPNAVKQLDVFLALTQTFFWMNSTILLAFLGVQTAQNFSSTATNALSSLVNNTSATTTSRIFEEKIEAKFQTPELVERYLQR